MFRLLQGSVADDIDRVFVLRARLEAAQATVSVHNAALLTDIRYADQNIHHFLLSPDLTYKKCQSFIT